MTQISFSHASFLLWEEHRRHQNSISFPSKNLLYNAKDTISRETRVNAITAKVHAYLKWSCLNRFRGHWDPCFRLYKYVSVCENIKLSFITKKKILASLIVFASIRTIDWFRRGHANMRRTFVSQCFVFYSVQTGTKINYIRILSGI